MFMGARVDGPRAGETMPESAMPEALLAGVTVVECGLEPIARAGRVLADLGADVRRLVGPGDDPLEARPSAALAWNAGKTLVAIQDTAAFASALRGADVVLVEPGAAGVPLPSHDAAPDAIWVVVTPFGATGPRAGWRASDLGVIAASANMFCTGDPDRCPVRPAEPAAYAHSGAEIAFAALTALASGRPQQVDVSMQEVVFVANMTTPAAFPRTGFRGQRRGASIGRTREIWPTTDGFVSYGLRGGKARVPSLQTLTRLVDGDGLATPALTERDWSEFSPATATDEELHAIEEPVAAYFARHTMRELYEIACETNLMLAPANSPPEVYASEQLASREFFGPVGDAARFPRSFVVVRSADGNAAPARPSGPARVVGASVAHSPRPAQKRGSTRSTGAGAWDGVHILEFGSGAAGPIATRYFAEHGATVLRVESKSRPDFLRVYALGPKNPHGLEGAGMYDGLNVGKLNVTLNLKHPEAVALVTRLVVEWADAVAENFAPRAMKGFGLDYDTLAAIKPDLVMVSACLNGQTGPHKDYPGFGGQGSALSGWNWLTGWPDREPVGPHGTITDSLAPRYVASALAAGLLYRRRTGKGVYLDVSQVESALWSLSPWLLDFERDGIVGMRTGNRSPRAVPHGAFPCTDEDGVADRWVAIAAWNDDEWDRLATVIGAADASLATLAARQARVDDVEAAVAAWTRTRTRIEVAETLQARGIEAVPVADFGDVHSDPQVAGRDHFVALEHPFMGPGLYERNGFRLSDAPSGYTRSGPTLGQDNDWVLQDLLGLTDGEISALQESGAVE
jgi:crotonobetainyl-CoA:carnitine CoA-transferase CaiB-like acyl-CoA transferase